MIKKRFNKIKVYLSYEIFDNDNQKQLDVDRVVDLLNALSYENEQLKKELRLKEDEKRINCRKCSYFISTPSSDCCLRREDIGYKGTCIDGMDYYHLAKNCPYYLKGDVE